MICYILACVMAITTHTQRPMETGRIDLCDLHSPSALTPHGVLWTFRKTFLNCGSGQPLVQNSSSKRKYQIKYTFTHIICKFHSFILLTVLFNVYIYIFLCVSHSTCVEAERQCKGSGSLLPPCDMWVLRTKLRLSGLETSIFIHWTILLGFTLQILHY